MDVIAALLVGQSHARGPFGSTNGNHDLRGEDWAWNNGQEAFGTAFRQAEWGKYPYDKQEPGQPYVNNLMQGFAEDMPAPVYSVHVAKPAQPIEAFIAASTLASRGWTLDADATSMAPYLYDVDQGARIALAAIGKPAFDVVLWHQGEAGVASYYAKLRALHSNMTNATLIGPETIFLCGGLWDGGPNYSEHKAECIRACASLPNAAYVDSAGLVNQGGNSVHLRGTGIIALGRRLRSKYQQMTSANSNREAAE